MYFWKLKLPAGKYHTTQRENTIRLYKNPNITKEGGTTTEFLGEILLISNPIPGYAIVYKEGQEKEKDCETSID